MKKRTFLKTSAILSTGSILVNNLACKAEKAPNEDTKRIQEPLQNWAKNLTYATNKVSYPADLDAAIQFVKSSDKLRGLGSRHCFNKIADSQNQQVCTRDLNKLLEIDNDSKSVRIDAGLRYGDFCEKLHAADLALHNLASLPHISVAGACSTSTHGSGISNGSLATSVSSFELVRANGEVVEISKEKDTELFNGAIIGLGALGLITKMTLELEPSFNMQQVVYENMPMSELSKHFEEVMSSAYSVSLFTDWKDNAVNEVWIKSRVDAEGFVTGDNYFGASLANTNLHPVKSQSAESCTEQMGIEGAWYERLPHFKMGFTPSSGDELQAEYFVPIENGFAAMAAIEKLNEQISPHLFISEIRTIAADDFWMSPFYKKACVAIHFTFKPHKEAVYKLMPQIEETLSAYGVRPHWGKLFTIAPEILQSRIERINDFRELMKEFDPKQKFVNEFIKKNILIT